MGQKAYLYYKFTQLSSTLHILTLHRMFLDRIDSTHHNIFLLSFIILRLITNNNLILLTTLIQFLPQNLHLLFHLPPKDKAI